MAHVEYFDNVPTNVADYLSAKPSRRQSLRGHGRLGSLPHPRTPEMRESYCDGNVEPFKLSRKSKAYLRRQKYLQAQARMEHGQPTYTQAPM